MDIWVQKAQAWLNSRYRNVSGYQTIAEDGVTGWGTMYALTRALQHELGITALSNNFGDGTSAAFSSKIGTLSPSTKNVGVVGILQCALWCKGYSGDVEFGKWTSVVTSSVASINTQLGLRSDGTVNAKLMRSLLTLDAYVIVGGGTDPVRRAQQWINGRYAAHSTYRLVPCDGLYSRDVQYGFMFGIQFELGMADSVANGNFGPGTQSGLKTQASVAAGSVDGAKAWVSLFQIALLFNGFSVTRNGTFDEKTRTATTSFQQFLLLDAHGRGDFDTWAALLVSTGNPNRAVTGIDTTTKVTQELATQLRSEGYTVIGRYLTVEAKSIARGELERLFAAGFSLIPIMQNYNNAAQYFTYEIGYTQGYQAAMRARQLGLPRDSVIFFPVDYDAFATEVDGILKNYFAGVRAGLDLSVNVPYRVGIYATRYIADRVYRSGWADAIWVSGMSTGYSGNLAYPMPQGWSYNQIQELHDRNLDRNAVSPSAQPVRGSEVALPPSYNEVVWKTSFEFTRLSVLAERALSRQPLLPPNKAGQMVLWYLQTGEYDDKMWTVYTPLPETSAGVYGEKWGLARGDLYLDAGPVSESLTSFDGDIQHLAATANGVCIWGDSAGARTGTAGDLGGWSADLLTMWADYGSLGVGKTADEYVTEYLGGTSGRFSYDDLLADAEGWLLGRRMHAGTNLVDAHRAVRSAAHDDTSILRLFLQERFAVTSEATTDILKAAIRDVFVGPWPISSLPRTVFLGLDGSPDQKQLQSIVDSGSAKLLRMAGLA
ncbi:hypothetical protein GCM10017714_02770 [Curtobacterium pusillum]|uniref:DUF1906 domain-containing protein n=1 Tax=Curtobacterium pusillum TaxID=69373 RepID=A0ABX2M4F6_9MICO|nr:glycoside hydrolase domain-containing protein [Curtobacterium pusillum]NUU13004.1 DUF1906 domain-containing protein [Curtobacterium pusillum]GLK31230.1 hypothetical protein GCM10017610_15150 [Curtobacterium pusillum]